MARYLSLSRTCQRLVTARPAGAWVANRSFVDRSAQLQSSEFRKIVDNMNMTPEEQLECENVSIPEPYSMREHLFNLKKFRALRKAGFEVDAIPQAQEDYDVSIGQFSLEWTVPSPPQVHTFEEPPIIKEAPDYVDE